MGTARNTTSKVWFTVADGVLSDTYWPTVDATNVHTLQYLVTDGQQLHRPPDPGHDLQGRARPTGMSCTVVASEQRPTATGSPRPTSPIRHATPC